jgi:hypothetical protein
MKTAKPTKLSLAEMRQVVLQEMDHIPRWPKDLQSYLRAAYWLYRMNSLGKKATVPNDRGAVLKRCLESLAKDHPGVDFGYDKAFFRLPSGG